MHSSSGVSVCVLASEEGSAHSDAVFVRRNSCRLHCCSVRRKISPRRRRRQRQQEWTVVLVSAAVVACGTSWLPRGVIMSWNSLSLVPVTCCPSSPTGGGGCWILCIRTWDTAVRRLCKTGMGQGKNGGGRRRRKRRRGGYKIMCVNCEFALRRSIVSRVFVRCLSYTLVVSFFP